MCERKGRKPPGFPGSSLRSGQANGVQRCGTKVGTDYTKPFPLLSKRGTPGSKPGTLLSEIGTLLSGLQLNTLKINELSIFFQLAGREAEQVRKHPAEILRVVEAHFVGGFRHVHVGSFQQRLGLVQAQGAHVDVEGEIS